MKKSFLFICAMVMLLSCQHSANNNNSEKKIIVSDIQNRDSVQYIKTVDSLGLMGFYTAAKWRIYCIYCDDSLIIHDGFDSDTVTFGELSLCFNCVPIRVQIDKHILADFIFLYHNKSIFSINAKLPPNMIRGVYGKMGSDSVIGYYGVGDIMLYILLEDFGHLI